MCIRCRSANAPGPLGLCAACVLNSRREIAAGLARFGEYLDAWAAFSVWLERRSSA